MYSKYSHYRQFYIKRAIHVGMDNLDIQILSRLMNNCRMSARQIAMETEKTSATINSRIQRMQRDGIIREFSIRVEPSMFGYGVLYFAVSGEDANRILEQICLVGEPYVVVPCIGGITLCSIVVRENIQEKIEMINGLMKHVRMLFIFEAESPGYGPSLTKTDLRVLGELVRNPRQRIETVASKTCYSTKTVARCITRLQDNDGVQFTLACDPRRFDGFIYYVIMVQIDGDLDRTLGDINRQFSGSYLHIPFVARNQIVLFMSSDSIFRMDELTHEVRMVKNVRAADLFIPKKILLYNKWLEGAMDRAESLPGLHVDARRLGD